MRYIEIAKKIIELMKNDEKFSDIKHYDTNYFDDRKQVAFPACSVLMTGKNPIQHFDDGKVHWNLNYEVSIYMKGAKAQMEKAYSYDEAFAQILKDNRRLGGSCVDAKIYSSTMDISNNTGQIMTILRINIGVEVIM